MHSIVMVSTLTLFITETGEEFENGRLPTLDMEMWIENGRILYSFYEKPVAAKTVINQKSALM